jgi:hypothetical protein
VVEWSLSPASRLCVPLLMESWYSRTVTGFAVWAVAAVGRGKVVVLDEEAWDGVGFGIRKAVGSEGRDVLGSETGMVFGSELPVALDPGVWRILGSDVVPASDLEQKMIEPAPEEVSASASEVESASPFPRQLGVLFPLPQHVVAPPAHH